MIGIAKEIKYNFQLPTQPILCLNISSVGCLGTELKSVTLEQTDGCQLKLELLRLSRAGACAIIEQLSPKQILAEPGKFHTYLIWCQNKDFIFFN